MSKSVDLHQLCDDVHWLRGYFERREQEATALRDTLRAAYGTGPYTVRQVLQDAARDPTLRAVLGDVDAAQLGRALAKTDGVERLDKTEHGSALWRCTPW